MHLDVPVGETPDLFGQDHALANHSVQPENEKAQMTKGTSGRSGLSWSSNAGLPLSLESRLLQAKLLEKLTDQVKTCGSTLYKLTWKEHLTPQQRLIYRLRASALHISGSDYGSWPTPAVRDYKETGDLEKSRFRKDGKERNDTVPRVAAGWATPKNSNTTGVDPSSRKTGVSLQTQAGWATPRQNDSEKRGKLSPNPRNGLPMQSQQIGQIATGTSSGTASNDVLNPAHSRWLIGLPKEWDDCVPTETLSCLKSRRAS